MANTENIEAKLCAYVDGELDPAGRAEIEAHLESNPQHRQLMTQLMQQRDLLSGLPRERAPEDLFEAMQNQLERSVLLDGDAAPGGAGGGSPHIAGRINPWPQRFAAAAVLLLAVGLAAVIYFVLPNQHQPPDYARVGGAAASAPIARAESTRRLNDLGAATSPTALARADADRVESKAGAMKAETIAPTDLGSSGATTQPTAVAVAPTPSLPAAPPAAAAAAPADIFTKNGGSESKSSDFNAASTMTNVFADAQINETLKAAPGVPDNSMLVVVNAGNPSATNQQIRAYFDNNGIKWEPAAEPMPEPLELRQSQTVMRSRLGNTQMKLKGGGNVGDAAEGQGGGGGFGGQNAAAPPPPTPPPSPATTPPLAEQERNRDLASAQDAAKRDQTLEVGGQADKSAVEGSKVAAPAAPAPAAKDSAPSAGADSVALNAQKQMRGGSNASDATSGLSATGGASGSTGTGTGSIAGAAAATPPANGKLAGNAGGPTSGKKDGWREIADTDDAKRQQRTDEIAQAPSPSPAQPQAKPSESSAPSQSSAAAAPSPELEQQRQQGQQTQMQQQVAAQSPQQQQQQLQQQGQLQYGQSPQAHQVFIARGLTRQQVASMNSALANGNRINNYNRAGATITPTTLPTLASTAAEAPFALSKKEIEAKALTTAPTGAATAPATAPTTAGAPLFQSGDQVELTIEDLVGPGVETRQNVQVDETGRLTVPMFGAMDAAGLTPQDFADKLWQKWNNSNSEPPSGDWKVTGVTGAAKGVTGTLDAARARTRQLNVARAGRDPITPTTRAASAPVDDRIDVVILVQPENAAAFQQLEQAAPNAAATDAPATSATTTATTAPAAATMPTSKP